jgi:hypothetical protein
VLKLTLEDAQDSARSRKNIGIATLFIVSTFYQLIIGLKVSAYKFGGGGHHTFTFEAIMMCIGVFWVNLEVYTLRTIIDELTRQDGLFLPKVRLRL